MTPSPEIEDEDVDYDPFASVRPARIEVDDNPEDEFEDSVPDYDPFEDARPKVIKNKSKSKSESQKFTTGEIIKDVAAQGIKETLIGAAGTWGDLAELAGIRADVTPGANARNSIEFEALERMEQPGYKPKFSDIILANDSSEMSPSLLSLPTSENLRDLNEFIGGPGEPKTPQGKYAARSGKLYGSGLAFGQVNPIPVIAAGTAGQAVEDLGGGPLLQMGAEIATLLLSQGKGAGKTLVGSAKKEVQDKINQLRKMNYSEKEITLAINSGTKGKVGGLKASKGSKTEQAFEEFFEKSDDIVSNILGSKIPGYDKGIKYVHELASDAYGQVAKDASKLVIKDSTPFINSATEVVKDVRKTLGKNPESEAFINRLYEAVVDSTKNPTAENFMNFYKELNGMGKWMGRSQKDRLITKVKEGIKETFRSEGKAGKDLAQKFEKANKGVSKAYDAQEVFDLMQKVTTQDGIDYKKLYKSFDKPDNVKLFEDVLGATQAKNLNLIAKTGKEIKDFDKAWKATSLITGTKTSLLGNAAYLMYSGNWPILIAGKVTEAAGRKLAEKSLTDPRFQNLLIRGINAIKNESPRSFKSAQEAMQKYLDDEKIDINLDQNTY